MSIKEELQEIRSISKAIDSKNRQLAQLKKYYTTVKGQDYSKDKVYGGIRQDFTDTVNKIVDLENEITKDIDLLCDKKKDLEQKIKCLNTEEYVVVQLRYFEELQWEEICLKINASWRKTHYIHSRALKNLEKKIKVCTLLHTNV